MDEEYRRRLREEEEAGFSPQYPGVLDGSLGSDQRSRSSSSGLRDDYHHPYPPQHAHAHPHQNGFVPRNSSLDAQQFSNRGYSSYSDLSPTQPNRDSGYLSNRNSRPSQPEPEHSRQSSDSFFNDNQLNKAQENIDLDRIDASFEKTPFFSPKHRAKDAKSGMNLRPLSDLFDEVDSKGRDENFNMKPSQYPAQNVDSRWENLPHSRYSYDPPSSRDASRDPQRGYYPYGAPAVDYDAYTGREPRLYKGYSDNLAQPQSQWQDLKTPQERQEKLRSDRYGSLPGNGQTEDGPVGSSSPRQGRRAAPGAADPGDVRPNSSDPRALQQEESLRQLHEWKQRVSNAEHPAQQARPHPSHHHNPIYENLNTSYESGPGRPPLPAAYRDKIVQVITLKTFVHSVVFPFRFNGFDLVWCHGVFYCLESFS